MYYELSDDSTKPAPPNIPPHYWAWIVVIIILSILWEYSNV